MPEELLHEREFTRTGKRPAPSKHAAPAAAAGNGHSRVAPAAANGSDIEMGVLPEAAALQSKVRHRKFKLVQSRCMYDAIVTGGLQTVSWKLCS